MKKLNLEMLRLTSADVLERSQMKKITGGYGGSSCCVHLRSTGNGSYLGRSCGYSFQQSQGWYFMSTDFGNGTYASGYCCASC